MPYLTIDEFANEYDFTRSDIRGHIEDGLPAETLGGSPRITVLDEEEAVRWLEERDLIEDVDGADQDLEDEDEDEDEDEN